MIKIENFSYWYPGKEEAALKNINLNIKSGEFVVVKGRNGSGKSTFLRSISGLVPKFYGGKIEGNLYINNDIIVSSNNKKSLQNQDASKIAYNVGFIFQEPEKQIIFSNVTKEIVFGMENLNFSYNKMKHNLYNIAKKLNINNLLNKDTNHLSGGELEKVAIASVLCMDTKIILIDEISQLDSESVTIVLNFIKKLNKEGVTIILSESFHNFYLETEKIIGNKLKYYKILYIDNGKVYINNSYNINNNININNDIIEKQNNVTQSDKLSYKKEIIKFNKVYFSYQNNKHIKNGKNFSLDIINININKGDFVFIQGEVGAGKSTLFKLLTLEEKSIYSGEIIINNRKIQGDINNYSSNIEYISKNILFCRNANDYLSQDSIEGELDLIGKIYKNSRDKDYFYNIFYELVGKFALNKSMDTHPRDLSCGERQKLVLSILFAQLNVHKIPILLLDEPTKGLDEKGIMQLEIILSQKHSEGVTILLTDHFYADRGNQEGYYKRLKPNKILYINKGKAFISNL